MSFGRGPRRSADYLLGLKESQITLLLEKVQELESENDALGAAASAYQQQCAELGGLVNQLARQLGESKDLNRKLAKELDRVTTDETVMEFVNTMLVTKLVMEHAVHEQDEKEIAALKEMNGALFAEVVKTKMEEDAIVRRASQIEVALNEDEQKILELKKKNITLAQEVDEMKMDGAMPEEELAEEAEGLDAVIHITQNT